MDKIIGLLMVVAAAASIILSYGDPTRVYVG